MNDQEVKMITVPLSGDMENTLEIPLQLAEHAGGNLSCKIEGRGTSSTVYKITGSNGAFALKITKTLPFGSMFEASLQEIKMMKELASVPSVVNIIDHVCVDERHEATNYILEPYLVSLDKYLHSYELSSIKNRLILCRRICDAVIEIMDHGILHLDLQPKNIFIVDYRNILIGDFSSSMYMTDIPAQGLKRGRGTPMFMAPESYSMGKMSERSEVYSIGVILFWLVNDGRIPFEDRDGRDLATYKRLAGTGLPDFRVDQRLLWNGDYGSYRIREDFLAELNSIVRDACRFDVNNRTNTVKVLRNELDYMIDRLKRYELEDRCSVKYTSPPARRGAFYVDPAPEIPGYEDLQWGPDLFDADPEANTLALFDPENAGDTVGLDECYGSGQISEHGNERKNERKVDMSRVNFSAIAPQTVTKGDYAIIDIAMYEDAFRHIVDELKAEHEGPVKEKSGAANLHKGSMVRIRLSSPDVMIEEDEIEQEWLGDYLLYSFYASIPEDYSKKKILFNACVYENDVPRTRIIFDVKCNGPADQRPSVFRKDIVSAFMSYASQDRSRVATIIQGMKALCPDLDIFFDVEKLRSGDDWEQTLYREIENRDMLFLCWSVNASNSEWVDREWRYALASKGIEGIEPVPIDTPDKCPPPEELSKLHFNDILLYVINTK